MRYIVMEYLEGMTLEARLQKGRLSLDDTLVFSVQIADALDKAHRRGVVHRDLKPANVMITSSGVKLLDFGLATQRGAAIGPTSITAPHDGFERITSEGAILGTLQYMAPEQLEGREADARTDIFAFGALLYEMVTGSPPFESGSQAGLIGAILRDHPRPVIDLAPGTPSILARTIARCLSKDPDERWQSANDLLFQLRSVTENQADLNATHKVEPVPTQRPSRRERVLWAAGIVAAVVASIYGTLLWRSQNSASSVSDPIATRFTLFPAPNTSFYSGFDMPFAVSPDGHFIAYLGVGADGTKQLWLRAWESTAAQPLAGTTQATMPFWSPDSQWIGFFANGALKKVRVSGGFPQTIANSSTTFAGAAWGSGDVILFPPGPVSGLYRVSAQGGPIVQVTKPAPNSGEGGHLWPRFLSDGNHFIYAAVSGRGNPGGIYLASLSGEEPRLLVPLQSVAVSSMEYASGHILYVEREGGLYARPFDEARLELMGEPIRIADGIPITGPGRAPFSASATGILAYWPYAAGTPSVLQWVDRTGRATPAIETPARYLSFRLSPDGRQLVFSRVVNDGRADLWIRDVERGTESRLTNDGVSFSAVWSPDSARLGYAAARGRPPELFIRALRATAADLAMGMTEEPDFPLDWSGDGRSIVSVSIDPINRNDLWIWQTQDESGWSGERLPLNSTFNEGEGRLSPDGRWLAYVTDESGQDEVWVASFPSGQNRRQVSLAGGLAPEWEAGAGRRYCTSRARSSSWRRLSTRER